MEIWESLYAEETWDLLLQMHGFGNTWKIPGEDETLSLISASTVEAGTQFFLTTQAGSFHMGLFTFGSAQATSSHPSVNQEKRNMQPELSHTR